MKRTRNSASTRPGKSAVEIPSVTMESAVDFIKTLSVTDLTTLAAAIEKQIRGKPMIQSFSKDQKFLKGLFSLYHLGTDDTTVSSGDIYPDDVHSYELVWAADGEKMLIKTATQEGVMYAGTTKYEVHYLQIGPLEIVGSFPEADRLPSGVSGNDDLFRALKKRGVVDSREQFTAFVKCVFFNVQTHLGIHHVDYIIENNLFDDIYDDEEEGEEGEDA